MRSLKTSERILITIAILAGIFAYTKYFLFRQKSENKKMEQQIVLLKTQIESTKLIIAKMKERQIASAATLGGKRDVRQSINQNSRFAAIYEEINSLASKQNLQIVRMTLDKQTEEKDIKKSDLSIEIESDFLGIGGFLEKIETSSLLAEVNSIEISRLNPDLKKCLTRIKISNYVLGAE